MKIRNGFVSNSSSSSFLIFSKEEVTKENLLKSFKVSEDSPLYFLSEKISDFILSGSEKITKENYMNDYGYEDEDESETIKEFDKWKNVFSFSAYSDDSDDEIAMMLYYSDFNIESDDIKIIKEY